MAPHSGDFFMSEDRTLPPGPCKPTTAGQALSRITASRGSSGLAGAGRVPPPRQSIVEYAPTPCLAETKGDHLGDREFHSLTYDMMLAWEAPDPDTEAELQVDARRTVGPEAFAKIALACPAMAHPITVRNLFDALTNSTDGRLHFLIYHKYLKSLDNVLRSTKCISGGHKAPALDLCDGEVVLDIFGAATTQPVLQHIGTLTLTNHALYFEAISVDFSYGDAVVYDLTKDLKQCVKRESTGTWGAHLFDKAVMYKSSSIWREGAEKEPEAIRSDTWGSKEKKPKTVAKPRDRFRFDWASTDDTNRVDAANNQPAHGALLLYGRGFLRMVSGWCWDARASASGYTCGAPSWASRGDRPSRPPPPSLDLCCRCGVSHFVLRRRRRRSNSNQYESTSLLQVEGVSTKEDVSYYAGKRIAYVYKAKTKSSGTTLRCIWGKVTRPHGNSGVVHGSSGSTSPPPLWYKSLLRLRLHTSS
ncbi:hypothetical protein ZWY2020_056566 [Hordeum vulgare]|nr:hypothetical protein ZWY2020_056566 [Hordeum vulgare]